MYVSEIKTTAPEIFSSPLQEAVYALLGRLGMTFERVDTDPGITMEDCVAIGRGLGVDIVKSLFLCNRQKTEFYLFVTTADKPFSTKDFSRAMGISRVSFARPDLLLSMLGTPVGATTILSATKDRDNRVKVVIDKDTVVGEKFGCSDGTAECFIKLRTEELLERYLPATGHSCTFIEV